MSLKIKQRSNPDDLLKKLRRKYYNNKKDCIDRCINEGYESNLDDYLKEFDWDLHQSFREPTTFYISDLREKDKEIDLPDVSKFGEKEYLIILSYLKNEFNKLAEIVEKGEENMIYGGDKSTNRLVEDLLFKTNRTFYMEVE